MSRSRGCELHEIFSIGIYIPKRCRGINMVYLPTMKTHVFTTKTGAAKEVRATKEARGMLRWICRHGLV